MKIVSGEMITGNSTSVKPAVGRGMGTERKGTDSGSGIVSEGLNIASERTKLDALILAQVSRNVIDKAIAISSRLKSIASEALTTGTFNNSEVETELSRIQGTISQYGERVFTPTAEKKAGRDEFVKNAELVNNVGRNILGGMVKNEDLEKMDRALEGFNKLRGTDRTVAAGKELQTASINETVSGIKKDMASGADRFLTAQGNINGANAKILTN